MIYHKIKLGNGMMIYLPTSLPEQLYQFVDISNLVKDKELDAFKRKLAKEK